MNGWRSRFLIVALFAGAMWGHSMATAWIPNTPEGMLLFHGSAALVELLLILLLPIISSGRLCSDMELLCFVSMAANFAGWMAYLAYLPPIYYDAFMVGLTIVQTIRVLLVDDDTTHSSRVHLVRGGADSGPAIHS